MFKPNLILNKNKNINKNLLNNFIELIIFFLFTIFIITSLYVKFKNKSSKKKKNKAIIDFYNNVYSY